LLNDFTWISSLFCFDTPSIVVYDYEKQEYSSN